MPHYQQKIDYIRVGADLSSTRWSICCCCYAPFKWRSTRTLLWIISFLYMMTQLPLMYTNYNSLNTEYIFVTPLSRSKDTEYAWEDVKALFNGGSRKRTSTSSPTDPELSPLPSKITPPAAGMFSSVNETTPSYESLSKSLNSASAGGSFTRHAIPTAAANYSLFSANLHSLFTSSLRCVSAVWALFRLFLLCRPINV